MPDALQIWTSLVAWYWAVPVGSQDEQGFQLVPTRIVEKWQTLCLGDLASLPVTVTNCPDRNIRGRKVCFSSWLQLTVHCYGEVTAARENGSHTFPLGAESNERACTLVSACPLSLPFHPGPNQMVLATFRVAPSTSTGPAKTLSQPGLRPA